MPNINLSAQLTRGIIVNDIHSQLNVTRVRSIVIPKTLNSLLEIMNAALREHHVISVAGARHAMGSQAFATDGVLIDVRKLDQVLSFDSQHGLIEVEAGIQWPALLKWLISRQRGRHKQWTFAQKQTGADRLTIGGCLSANVHGRGLALPPFISDIHSFKLINARGKVIVCSRKENADLFCLAIGGYGLFGLIYSVTLKLVPRRKVQRIVEICDVSSLSNAFKDRIRDGYVYGDFQYSIDERSDGFLNRGVFSCYKLAPNTTAISINQKQLAENDWEELLYLAHTDKAKAFTRYTDYYLSTNGQIYWSDEHQMSTYTDDYHHALSKRLKDEHKATEVITEVYCERDAIVNFMSDVRQCARRHRINIIYGTIRLIEQDKESFLAWAKKPYICVIFNLHVVHTSEGIRHAANAFRRIIDIGIRYGGSYYLTYHKYATRKQVETCYPQFPEFLKLKNKYDPFQLFQSDWYRHYNKMFLT